MAEPNYVAEAFKLKQNLLFLAVGLAAAFVLASPVAAGVVAALEVLFLFQVSSNPRFRRAIRARGGL